MHKRLDSCHTTFLENEQPSPLEDTPIHTYAVRYATTHFTGALKRVRLYILAEGRHLEHLL